MFFYIFFAIFEPDLHSSKKVRTFDLRNDVFMNVFKNMYLFYYEGFKSMTVGKTLWLIILIKLAIMFLVLKLFFFPDFLGANFSTDAERADYVTRELTAPVDNNNVNK
jgi:hypothetical protein